jgi:hypothetical protein
VDERRIRILILHGASVLFLGLLAGIPYGSALVNGWGDEAARAWKLTHMEGIQNGILVLALAGCGRFLRLGPGAAGLMTWAVIAAAYGNVVGAGLGALVGERGLAPTGPVGNAGVFTAFMFGMWGVLIGVPLAAFGAWQGLRGAADS